MQSPSTFRDKRRELVRQATQERRLQRLTSWVEWRERVHVAEGQGALVVAPGFWFPRLNKISDTLILI